MSDFINNMNTAIVWMYAEKCSELFIDRLNFLLPSSKGKAEKSRMWKKGFLFQLGKVCVKKVCCVVGSSWRSMMRGKFVMNDKNPSAFTKFLRKNFHGQWKTMVMFFCLLFTHHIAQTKSLALRKNDERSNEGINIVCLVRIGSRGGGEVEIFPGSYLSFCCAAVLSILMQCSDDIQKSFLTKSLYNPGFGGQISVEVLPLLPRCSTFAIVARWRKISLCLVFYFPSCCAKFKRRFVFIPYLSSTLTLFINIIKARNVHQKQDIHVSYLFLMNFTYFMLIKNYFSLHSVPISLVGTRGRRKNSTLISSFNLALYIISIFCRVLFYRPLSTLVPPLFIHGDIFLFYCNSYRFSS